MEYYLAIKRNEILIHTTQLNVDEFQDLYIDWKKSYTNDHVLYNSIYVKFWKGKALTAEADQGLLGTGMEEVNWVQRAWRRLLEWELVWPDVLWWLLIASHDQN